MGLFNIFKKRPYDFETLLKRAVTEPAFRIEFYKRILTENLVVIINNTNLPEGEFVSTENTKVQVLALKDQRIPVFTSTERIFDNGVIKEKVNFLELEGRVLLKMLTDKTLIINPYSNYGKEILPDEIKKILDGAISTANVQHLEIKKNTNIKIGQPAVYPTALVKSFTKLFSERLTVEAAYLGWIHDPESDIPPHYIFAVEETGDWNDLTQEMGYLINQIQGTAPIVDLLKIDEKDGICGYFVKSTTPFYKKYPGSIAN